VQTTPPYFGPGGSASTAQAHMFWCDALSAPAAAARRWPPRGHRPPALHGCGARAPPSRPPARRRLPKLKSPPDAQATGRRAAPRVLTYSSAPVHAGVSARSAGAHVLLVLPLAALLVRPTISQAGASGMSWPSSASQSSTAAPASRQRKAEDGCGSYQALDDSKYLSCTVELPQALGLPSTGI